MSPEGILRLVDATGSTNDDVRSLACAGAPHGTAVCAREQTAGRGRRGHAWSSPRGGLYLSVLLRPDVPVRLFSGLPAACALGTLRVLRDDLGVRGLSLKWPNDLMLDGGKLAGILIEASSDGGCGGFAVCGVGLNLTGRAEDVACDGRAAGAAPLRPAFLRSPAEDCVGFDGELATLAESLRRGIVAAVDAWASSAGRPAGRGPLAPVLSEYNDVLAYRGREVVAFDATGAAVASGVLEGVDEWGRAVVDAGASGRLPLASEEVSLRLRRGGGATPGGPAMRRGNEGRRGLDA